MTARPNIIPQSAALILGILSLTACENSDVHPRDTITVLYYVLTPEDGSRPDVTLYYEDMDGPDGRNPMIIGGQLSANTTYNGTLHLRFASEKSSSDAEHLIIEQGIFKHPESHQVFYTVPPALDMIAYYTDRDTFGLPIGLRTRLVTGAQGQGTLTVTVRYDVNKTAPGVAQGDMTYSGGANDIEVVFPVVLQSGP
ncbi:MAG: type 1 periplasmic binding fold superfamily protein [Flavobacteriales bacterium]|nr:type 1 periplasmic binding fold superfamily protein [Flavobacteriales bacterium]